MNYQGKRWRTIWRQLAPLGLAALMSLTLNCWIQSLFSPDPILRPWIYLADLFPWFMAFLLGVSLVHRLPAWNGPWRAFVIAIVGTWLAVTVSGVLNNVNDEIGARRMAAAGSDDPYDLYGDESGMRNHGTTELAADTWQDFLGALTISLALSPFLLFVAMATCVWWPDRAQPATLVPHT